MSRVRRGRRLGAPALVADVVVRQREAGALIVRLLRQHAVEADVAAAEVGDGFLPDAQAVALASMLRLHDVQAEEAVRGVVGDPRERGDRLAVEQANEEASRVSLEEQLRVVQAGIPALGGGPLDGEARLGRLHGTHDIVAQHALLERPRGTSASYRAHGPHRMCRRLLESPLRGIRLCYEWW